MFHGDVSVLMKFYPRRLLRSMVDPGHFSSEIDGEPS